MSLRRVIETFGRMFYRILTPGMETEYTFSRFAMYRSIKQTTARMDFAGPALSISHSRHLLDIMGAPVTEISDANYPEANILRLPFADNTFGVVVSDQVYEHIDGLPSAAMQECLRVLKPGGWVLHTTCFFTAYHGPGDFWRFTPEGLEKLARLCGAQEAIARGCGHPVEFVGNLLGWTRLGVPKASWHPLRWFASLSRFQQSTTVWVLAQK